MMNISGLEEEARLLALKQVSSMLQRPDQLEKLDIFKKRSARKKAAVEAMLKTGVQSQLEGVRTGISQLQAAAEDIKTIGENLHEIFELLDGFPELQKKLGRLRDENMKHSQYAAAMENLKHIFNVPETIEKTHELVVEGKLLVAHKNVMELETARDDLLFEVHKLPTETDYDKNLLKTYFSEVDKLAQDLGKQLWYILGRTLEAVRGSDPGPQQVVTALRIIEREERIDKYYEDRKVSTNGFMPPGRPRKWKEKCFEVLEKNVRQRIEGNQLEDRTINKQWLARYLEICRRVTSEDLRVAKSGTVSVFPPDYQIYDRYVGMYHHCIARRLREIASDDLQKNELVQLLSWIQTYSTDQMLGNPRLQINVQAMLQDVPLLPKSTLSQLADKFVQVTRKDISEWLEKSLHQEKNDWYKTVHPEQDSSGYYYTALPAILFQMVEDQVQLAKEISADIVPNVVFVNVEELLALAGRYKDAAIAYKNKHFEDRSRFELFTPITIAMANNFDICVDSTDKVKKHVRLTMETDMATPRGAAGGVNRQELLEKIDQLKLKWSAGCQTAETSLLEEISQDMAPHLAEIMTKKWASGGGALETICATIADYHMDYKHLRPHIMCVLLMDLQYKVLGEYLKAIENRRITFANFDERNAAADRLKQEARRMESLFKTMTQGVNIEFEYLMDVLPALADVLSLRDKGLLALEVSGLVRKFPDITVDHLSAIIQLREDTGRADARSLAEEIIQQNKYHPKGNAAFVKLFQSGKSEEKRLRDFDFASLTLGGLSRLS